MAFRLSAGVPSAWTAQHLESSPNTQTPPHYRRLNRHLNTQTITSIIKGTVHLKSTFTDPHFVTNMYNFTKHTTRFHTIIIMVCLKTNWKKMEIWKVIWKTVIVFLFCFLELDGPPGKFCYVEKRSLEIIKYILSSMGKKTVIWVWK